jgi:dihydrofolate reductase
MEVGAHSSASRGEILVYGSRRLSRVLIGMGLVDELPLLVYPVVLGAGGRLFGETQVKAAATSGLPVSCTRAPRHAHPEPGS